MHLVVFDPGPHPQFVNSFYSEFIELSNCILLMIVESLMNDNMVSYSCPVYCLAQGFILSLMLYVYTSDN